MSRLHNPVEKDYQNGQIHFSNPEILSIFAHEIKTDKALKCEFMRNGYRGTCRLECRQEEYWFNYKNN